MRINFSAPLNSLSFGHCSLKILDEFYKKGIDINLFPIQENIDVSAYNISPDFRFYLESARDKAKTSYDKKDAGFKLWHIQRETVSQDQVLFTFHELDGLTPMEVNILRNQKAVLVSSKFTQEICQNAGLGNVTYCPLGFDSSHFKKTNRIYHDDGVIIFSLFGKFEKRKHTERVIRAWLSKYGNRREYILNLHVFNPFFSPEQNDKILMNIFGGQKPFNVNCLPYVKTLAELNDGLNACDIVLDMSGGEGFSIPSFSALALGKHGVVHNCSSIKDWAADSGAVLVEPTGKEPVYDGVFFHPGADVNQGNIFTWNPNNFLSACETAVSKYVSNPVNEIGLGLQKKYTWENTADIILHHLS